MIVYYLGLLFILCLLLGCLYFCINYQKYSTMQSSYLIGSFILAIAVVGVGYYQYGAFNGLRSVYAYREIHILLSELQKKQMLSSSDIEKSLSDLYQRLPQIEQVHTKMGEVFLAANFPIQAEKAYAAALKVDPTNRDYAYGFYYAQSLRYQGILSQAAESALTKLIVLFPKDNGFLNLLAVNSFQTKQYAKAIEYWKKIKTSNSEEMSLIQQMINQAKFQLDQAT